MCSYSLTSSRNSLLSFLHLRLSDPVFCLYTFPIHFLYSNTLHTKSKQNQSREFKLRKQIYKRKAVPKKANADETKCSLCLAVIVTNKFVLYQKKSISEREKVYRGPERVNLWIKWMDFCAREYSVCFCYFPIRCGRIFSHLLNWIHANNK